MLHVVPKWKVSVTLRDGAEHTIWIHENVAANVLRKVADIQFAQNGLNDPVKVLLSVSDEPMQTGTALRHPQEPTT
jgi:hypothetical protein